MHIVQPRKAEGGLLAVEGREQPLAPVPVDLQLGAAPHDVQALHLGCETFSYLLKTWLLSAPLLKV